MAEPVDWEAALKDAGRQIGAARLAAAVTANLDLDGPLHPDIIAGIERLTGERYDPGAGTWAPGPEPGISGR